MGVSGPWMEARMGVLVPWMQGMVGVSGPWMEGRVHMGQDEAMRLMLQC